MALWVSRYGSEQKEKQYQLQYMLWDFSAKRMLFFSGDEEQGEASPLYYQYMTLRVCQLMEAGRWGWGLVVYHCVSMYVWEWELVCTEEHGKSTKSAVNRPTLQIKSWRKTTCTVSFWRYFCCDKRPNSRGHTQCPYLPAGGLASSIEDESWCSYRVWVLKCLKIDTFS
jgi:hypothetical protein